MPSLDFLLPPGIMFPYAGSTVPGGFLLCDGTAVSRTTYAALFAAVGTTWGVGNGTTTFNVPDLRGRALVGAGAGSGLTSRALGGTAGTEAGSHFHQWHDVASNAGAYDGLTYNNSGASATDSAQSGGGSGAYGANAISVLVGNAGGSKVMGPAWTGGPSGSTDLNMQPSAFANMIIKF